MNLGFRRIRDGPDLPTMEAEDNFGKKAGGNSPFSLEIIVGCPMGGCGLENCQLFAIWRQINMVVRGCIHV